ncbi:MAG: hypothetical protein JNL75_01605 [Chitinophagales bacterium]|nr:hypothetical protein [Chitinophagales bacterium]
MDGWDKKIDTGRLTLYSRFTIVYDLYRMMDLGIDNKESKYLTTIYKFSDCLNLKNDIVIIKTRIDLRPKYFLLVDSKTKEFIDTIDNKLGPLEYKDSIDSLRAENNEFLNVGFYFLAYDFTRDKYYRLKGYQKLDLKEFFKHNRRLKKNSKLYYDDCNKFLDLNNNHRIRIL